MAKTFIEVKKQNKLNLNSQRQERFGISKSGNDNAHVIPAIGGAYLSSNYCLQLKLSSKYLRL